MEYECLEDSVSFLNYFHPRMPPIPISFEQSPKLVCHDVRAYGLQDSVLFPRLNQKEASFKFWDSSNLFFFDHNGDGYADVNNWIHDYAKTMNLDVPLNTSWFISFQLPEEQFKDSYPMGYIMPYWVDSTTYRSFCLSNPHYNTNNYQKRIYKVFHELLRVETEGLYVGKRLSGKNDFILIKETELKKVWFYYLNGKPTIPNDITASNYTIYFVSQGSVFQLMSSQELDWDPTGESVGYPSHDRKIGCVPKTMFK